MADLNIPQTKFAQNLKPYNGLIATYIREWDEIARAAGIANRKLIDSWKHGSRLVVVYLGTREQFEKSELIGSSKYQRWPSGLKVPTNVTLIHHSPLEGENRYPIYKVEENRYALQISQEIPDSVSKIEGGIERLDFYTGTDDEKNVFIGNRDLLISLGIATNNMFPDDSTNMGRLTNGLTNRVSTGGPFSDLLEKTHRLFGGKWSYTRYPKTIKNRLKNAEEGKLSGYSSPEEWLGDREDTICRIVRVFFSESHCSTDTKSGFRYSVDPALYAEILNDIEVAAQKICGLPVKVSRLRSETPNRESVNKADAASMDAAFQAFIRSALGKPEKRRRGKGKQ